MTIKQYKMIGRKLMKGNNIMNWTYDKKGYWCASRLMPDGVCNFIYCIYPTDDGKGYTANAMNNAYGAERIAVKSKDRKTFKPSVFSDLHKLMRDIENGRQLWMYTGYCNCIGKVTREEY
jgi:hypothetical protein